MGAEIECRRIKLPSKISKSQTFIDSTYIPISLSEDNLDLTLN
jgi:hypothetical protein